MSPFEIGMLVCFGFGWPMSIWKTLKSKQSAGKSVRFLLIVITGYVCGILHKIFFYYDFVIYLYILNLAMVAFDLYLTILYRKRDKEPEMQRSEISG